MKPDMPVLRSVRLLDQLRERIRYLHYSLSTEKAYVHWVRFSFAGKAGAGSCGIRARWARPRWKLFLTMLATERHVSASTHNQALSALLCFCTAKCWG
jgi:hypothetical protein